MKDLIVVKNIVGILETNIEELETFVKRELKKYSTDSSIEIADAKKDRAELNKSLDFLKTKRIEIIKKCMEPYNDFETRCKVLEKDIKALSDAIGVNIAEKEEKEKELKKEEIKKLWSSKNFNLFSVDKVFNQKWLNKSTSMKDIETDIDVVISKTFSDIKVIERFPDDDIITLKAMYLESLDIGKTLDRAEILKTNREIAEREKKEREEREHKEKIEEQREEILEDEQKEVSGRTALFFASQALGEEVDLDPVMEFSVTFKARKSVLFALRNYMTAHGIEYTKI